MSIGDVHSDARGSGARFNDGKAPLHLIPVGLIADSFIDAKVDDIQADVRDALDCLGSFQASGNPEYLLLGLGSLRSYWRDCAAVFEYGRKKYAEWNWAKGMPWSVPLACAARHALAILEGEETDRESGLRHVGHFQCNLVMLRTYVDSYPEGNDLPPASLFSRIPPPNYDPDSVAFRHGDPGKVCGMTDASTLTKYIYKHFPDGSATLYPEPTAEHGSTHPMAAEALRDQDGTTPGCAPWRLP